MNLLSVCGSSAAAVSRELSLTPLEETLRPEKRKVSLTILTMLCVLTRYSQAGNSHFCNFLFTAIYSLQYLVATHGAGSASVYSKCSVQMGIMLLSYA